MRAAVLGVLLLVACSGEARAECRARTPPTAGFVRRTEEIARNYPDRVRALEERMFTLTGEDEERIGVRTDAVLVVHQGALLYERYARGYDRTNPHLAWSVTKTITSLLTGRAVAEGALGLDDSVCRFVPEVADGKCAITVRHLLTMSSGLDWDEGYEGGERQASSVVAMLVGQGRRDMAAFVLGHDFAAAPGTAFRYSTGDTTALARVLEVAMRPTGGLDWDFRTLFEPLGLSS